MPRRARIDATGAVHHVIGRGINRQAIFSDKKDYLNFIERLGDGAFVSEVLSRAEERLRNKYRIKAKGFDLDRLIQRVAEIMELRTEEILDGIRDRKRAEARSILSYWATDRLGITQSQLAVKLNMTQSAISHAARRGKSLVNNNSYSIFEEEFS
jgi:chromosomal replication initiation ATPase DnaA